MSKTATKTAKGITALTMEKHSFEGFSVRMQTKGYTLRQYVSASESAHGKKTALSTRRKAAYADALKLRAELEGILKDPKNWRAGKLNAKVIARLTELGFSMSYAEPAKASA